MGFFTKPRLLSWDTPLFPSVAWLMGARLGGDEAGFASSFIMRKSCEHGHHSMVLVQPPTSGRGLLCNCCCSRGFALQLVGAVPPLPPCSAVLWFKFWRDSQCRRRSAPPEAPSLRPCTRRRSPSLTSFLMRLTKNMYEGSCFIAAYPVQRVGMPLYPALRP